MRTVEAQLGLAKRMIATLNGKTMRRTDWTILCVSETKCSPHHFDITLSFLVRNGYVEKVKQGVYRVTRKGERFATT